MGIGLNIVQNSVTTFTNNLIANCREVFTQLGVNFINILRAAFGHADHESAKKTDNLTVFFALLVAECVKAARKKLMKLTQALIETHL